MEANNEGTPPRKTSPEEVAAFFARVQAQGLENVEQALGEHRGRPEAAEAQPSAVPTWNDLVACLSNTPPQSSALPVEGFPNLFAACGIDWWEWTAAVAFEPVKFGAITSQFDAIKQRCQERREADAWTKVNDTPSFRVGRTGFNRGGDRSEYYDYRIFYNGIAVGLANRQASRDGMSNLCVVQRGSDCLRLGALISQQTIRDFVRRLGGTVLREKLSRADLCLDITNLDIRTFQPFIQNRQFISKAKNVTPFENVAANEWTGFVVGKRPMRIVVYDKVAELEKKQDELYKQAMIARRWGGLVPEHASRIELQVSREWLRKYGIDSPNDFLEKGSTIIERQLSHWFRLTTTRIESEKKTQSRAKLDPLWASLRKSFVNWFGLPESPLIPIDRKNVLPMRTIMQGIGCLRSAFLQMGYVLPTFRDFGSLIEIALGKAFPGDTERAAFVRDYWLRSSEYRA